MRAFIVLLIFIAYALGARWYFFCELRGQCSQEEEEVDIRTNSSWIRRIHDVKRSFCHLQESNAIRNLIVTHNQYVENLDKPGDETSALNHLQQCLEYSQRINDKEAVASCKYKVSKTR